MPSSRPAIIAPILDIIMGLAPKTILDVGVGFGKWGVLLREYLEVWQGRYMNKEWEVLIDGVEPWGPYYNDLHDLVYNTMHMMPVEEFLPLVERSYDLVLMSEVVEHMERGTAEEVLPKLWDLALKAIIITSPVGGSPQGEVFGNKYERHRSAWDAADFMSIFGRGNYSIVQGRYGIFWALK